MTAEEKRSSLDALKARITDHLTRLYPENDLTAICDEIVSIMAFDDNLSEVHGHINLWDETDVVAITYGDTIVEPGEHSLDTLRRFLCGNLDEVLSTCLLYTSDAADELRSV